MGTTPENPGDPGFSLIDKWLASRKPAEASPEEHTEDEEGPEDEVSTATHDVMQITSTEVDPLTAPLPQVLEQEHSRHDSSAPEGTVAGSTPLAPTSGQLSDDERRRRLGRMLKSRRLAPKEDVPPAAAAPAESDPDRRTSAGDTPEAPSGPRLNTPERFSVPRGRTDFAPGARTDVFAALRETDVSADMPGGGPERRGQVEQSESGHDVDAPAKPAGPVGSPTHSGESDAPRISDAAIMEPALQAVMRSIELAEQGGQEQPRSKLRRFGRRNRRSAASEAIRRAATPPQSKWGTHADVPHEDDALPDWLNASSTPTARHADEPVRAADPAVTETERAAVAEPRDPVVDEGPVEESSEALRAQDADHPPLALPADAGAALAPETEVPVAEAPRADLAQPELPAAEEPLIEEQHDRDQLVPETEIPLAGESAPAASAEPALDGPPALAEPPLEGPAPVEPVSVAAEEAESPEAASPPVVPVLEQDVADQDEAEQTVDPQLDEHDVAEQSVPAPAPTAETPSVADAAETDSAKPSTETGAQGPAKFETLEQLLSVATTRTGPPTVTEPVPKPVTDPEPDPADRYDAADDLDPAASAADETPVSQPAAPSTPPVEEAADTDDVPAEPSAPPEPDPEPEPEEHAPFRAPSQDERPRTTASLFAATRQPEEPEPTATEPTIPVPGPRTGEGAQTAQTATRKKSPKASQPTQTTGRAAKPTREKPPLPATIELSPQRGTRRFLGFLLLFAFMSTVLLGWIAWDVRTTEYIAFAATAGVLTLILWGAYSTSEPARIICERGLLDIRTNDSHHRFDLASPYTRLEVHGTPGRRGWKVHILRKSMPPYVIDGSMVDPHEFTRILDHFEEARNRTTH